MQRALPPINMREMMLHCCRFVQWAHTTATAQMRCLCSIYMPAIHSTALSADGLQCGCTGLSCKPSCAKPSMGCCAYTSPNSGAATSASTPNHNMLPHCQTRSHPRSSQAELPRRCRHTQHDVYCARTARHCCGAAPPVRGERAHMSWACCLVSRILHDEVIATIAHASGSTHHDNQWDRLGGNLCSKDTATTAAAQSLSAV